MCEGLIAICVGLRGKCLHRDRTLLGWEGSETDFHYSTVEFSDIHFLTGWSSGAAATDNQGV